MLVVVVMLRLVLCYWFVVLLETGRGLVGAISRGSCGRRGRRLLKRLGGVGVVRVDVLVTVMVSGRALRAEAMLSTSPLRGRIAESLWKQDSGAAAPST